MDPALPAGGVDLGPDVVRRVEDVARVEAAGDGAGREGVGELAAAARARLEEAPRVVEPREPRDAAAGLALVELDGRGPAGALGVRDVRRRAREGHGVVLRVAAVGAVGLLEPSEELRALEEVDELLEEEVARVAPVGLARRPREEHLRLGGRERRGEVVALFLEGARLAPRGRADAELLQREHRADLAPERRVLVDVARAHAALELPDDVAVRGRRPRRILLGRGRGDGRFERRGRRRRVRGRPGVPEDVGAEARRRQSRDAAGEGSERDVSRDFLRDAGEAQGGAGPADGDVADDVPRLDDRARPEDAARAAAREVRVFHRCHWDSEAGHAGGGLGEGLGDGDLPQCPRVLDGVVSRRPTAPRRSPGPAATRCRRKGTCIDLPRSTRPP